MLYEVTNGEYNWTVSGSAEDLRLREGSEVAVVGILDSTPSTEVLPAPTETVETGRWK